MRVRWDRLFGTLVFAATGIWVLQGGLDQFTLNPVPALDDPVRAIALLAVVGAIVIGLVRILRPN